MQWLNVLGPIAVRALVIALVAAGALVIADDGCIRLVAGEVLPGLKP